MKTTPPARFSKLPTTSLPLSLLTVALLTSTGDAQRQASPGSDAAIGIEGPLRYGRIVDVHAKSPKTGAVVPALRDVLVGEGAGVSAKASTANPAVPLTLREDPASGVSILEIGAEFDTRDESDFARALLEARRAAGVVAPATASSLPPFSEVPVDAAIAVELSAPLDPRSLTAESLRFTTGSNDRAAAGRLVWNAREPRQVLFDPKVGAADLARVEAELASGIRWNARLGHAPLHGFAAGQSHGFTPGGQSLGWNVRVQLATSGATLQSSAGVKPTAAQPPLSLTRVFRSGGPATALASTSVFTLIGTQGITPLTVGDSDPGTPGNDFLRVTFQYVDPTRDLGVQPGDSILQGVSFAIVQSVVDGTGPVYTADVTYVEGGAFVEKRVTDLTSLFGPQHAGKEGCFIGVRPQPLTFPMGGVDPQLQVFLAFSKPVDPATVDPLENVAVVVNGAVNPTNAGPFDVAVATAFDDTGDPARILYTPVLPLPHVQGQSEAYRLYVLGGAAGIRALDGSVLSFGLLDFQVPLTIDPAAPTNGSRGLSLRFNGILEGGGPQKVVNGQLSTPAPGTIAGRPVTHFVRYTDSTNPVVAAMQPFNAAGVQTPLVPLGSREMIAYRHVDIGLSVNALSEMDLDIEGLSWSIFNLFPPTDYFPHIKIAAAHSRFFPDEHVNGVTLLPEFPVSGLSPQSFDANILDAANHPETVLYDGDYAVNTNNAYTAPSGLKMIPWPKFTSTFTWRDTSFPRSVVGGPNGFGVNPSQYYAVYGLPAPLSSQTTPDHPFVPNQVPTAGLPLLFDFRSYPSSDPQTKGLNGFRVALASTSSSKPNFRVFSSGGVNTQGQQVTVTPDVPPSGTIPSGGFTPQGSQFPGFPTPPDGPEFYYGRVDFTVKHSRVFTHFYDLGTANPAFASSNVVLVADEPVNTSIAAAFRGATTASLGSLDDARCFDAYGNVYSATGLGTVPPPFFLGSASPCGTVTGLAPATTFTDAIETLNGKRFLMLRLTFTSDVSVPGGAQPILRSLGVAYEAVNP